MMRAIILFLCYILLENSLLYANPQRQSIPTVNRLTISGSGFQKGRAVFILKKWNKTFSATDHLADPVWINDSSFVISYKLEQPEIAILVSSFGNYDIYISPGDSIKVSLISADNKPGLLFKGEHSGNYNYSNAASKVFRNSIPISAIRNNNDHAERSRLIKRAYSVMDSFNVDFLQREKISVKFKRHIDSYKYWLAVNAFCPLPAIVNNKVIPDDFLIPDQYLSDPFLLNNRVFTLAVCYYIRGCLSKSSVNDLTNDNLKASAKIAIKHFKGLVREYILMALIQTYGRNQNQEWEDAFDRTVKKAVHIVKDPDYLADIYSWNAYFHKGNKPIPSDIRINTALIDTAKGAYTLSEVLDSAKGSLLFIDFWASWCGPCKMEFDFYNQHQEIYQNSGLKYKKLYLSIDEENDFEKWKKDIAKYDLQGMNYIIRGSKLSALFKYLQINGIPHYIIIDKNGVVRSLNAPRPSNFQQLIMILKDLGG